MLRLKAKTDPSWAKVALSDVGALLSDHAHCEKKAAATALALITTYPEHQALFQPLVHLAQEETRHFFSVMSELSRRGICLGHDGGDPYAAGLLARAAPNGPMRLRDRLLIAALIEARSCERFGLLAAEAPKTGEERLGRFWGSLFEAEARHHTLFMSLATEIFGEDSVRSRMAELQQVEAQICAELPLRAAIH